MPLDPKRLDLRIERVGNGWLVEPTAEAANAISILSGKHKVVGQQETFVAETPEALVVLVKEWAEAQASETKRGASGSTTSVTIGAGGVGGRRRRKGLISAPPAGFKAWGL